MRVSELIKKLQGLKSVEGDVEVFLAVDDNEGRIKNIMINRAEHLVDEQVYLGTGVEDYHQAILIEGTC